MAYINMCIERWLLLLDYVRQNVSYVINTCILMLKFTIFTKLRAQYQTIHDYIFNWYVISDLKYISIHQWRLAYFNTLSYMTRSHKGVTHGNIYKKTLYCTLLRDTYSLSKLPQYHNTSHILLPYVKRQRM